MESNFNSEIERRYNLQEEYLGTQKPVNRLNPLVSIRTTIYQHAPFIEACIKGVLMQETDFPFEMIIGDDGSDDGTTEICKKYAEEHPDIIRLFIRDRKVSHIGDEKGNSINRLNGRFTGGTSARVLLGMDEVELVLNNWLDTFQLPIRGEQDNNADEVLRAPVSRLVVLKNFKKLNGFELWSNEKS